ncbi:MAG: hypothetical protein AAF493_29075 [Pseudomonadota bacterium]
MQTTKKITTALLMMSVVSIASAGETDVAAQKACDCMGPVNALMQKMMAAMQAGDQSALQRMEPEMQRIQASSEGCFDKVKQDHPNIVGNQTREDEVAAKMQTICPRPGGWQRPQR